MIKKATSIRAERSFALVVEDYKANLRILSKLIMEVGDKFGWYGIREYKRLLKTRRLFSMGMWEKKTEKPS